MATPTNSNPFSSSGNPFEAGNSFGNVGNSLTNDNNILSSGVSFTGSSSIPTQGSILSGISGTFDSINSVGDNNLSLTDTDNSNPLTSSGNGAQNFGLRIRTAIDELVGGNIGSPESIPTSVTDNQSDGNNLLGNGRPQLGPFDRLLDIPGVDGPQDIFGGLGDGSASGGGNNSSFGGGSGVNPFSNFGNPNASDNPLLQGFTGSGNPWRATSGADTSETGNGNSFSGNSFSGNPFTSGVGASAATDASLTTLANSEDSSTNGQWTWNFSALENTNNSGGNPFAGGGSVGGNPFAGGSSVGGNPFAGGGSVGGNPFA